MLIKAVYEKDKVKFDHIQRVDGIMKYCGEIKKDSSNGFTKERTMRRIGSFPLATILEYDRTHPGFISAAMNPRDAQDKQNLWKEFLKSDYAAPFMMVRQGTT